MRYLSKIPLWGWLIILTVLSYAAWNPFKASVFHMWADNPQPTAGKLLVTLLLGGALFFFARETKKAIGAGGIAFLTIIIGLVLWLFKGVFVEKPGILANLFPFIIAVFLTIGSQFNKVRRRISGTVSVDHTEDDIVDMHGHD